MIIFICFLGTGCIIIWLVCALVPLLGVFGEVLAAVLGRFGGFLGVVFWVRVFFRESAMN